MFFSVSIALWIAGPASCLCTMGTGQNPLPSSPNVPGELDSRGIRGSLIISGGGQPAPIIKDRFLALAGNSEAKLVIIPTASLTADEAAKDHAAAWRDANLSTITILHTRDRIRADDPQFVAPLKSASAVWLSGGSQTRLSNAYVGTLVETELHALLARGGVIGGTSAGAAIMSRDMIASGRSDPKMGTGFGFLPYSIIDQHFLTRNRQTRSLKAVKEHPGRFGLGIDEGTAVEVSGRRIRVIGNSTVTVTLGPSLNRAARTTEVPADAILDLTSLRRAAIAREGPQFPPKKTSPPIVAKGALLIIGGGGVTQNMIDCFVESAGGKKAHLVVLPTAIEDSAARQSGIPPFLTEENVKSITVLPQRWRDEVNGPVFTHALEKATGVWFGGGRQWRFVDAYENTKAVELFNAVLERGGIIAGSSAGASIQAEYMVRGDPLGNQVVMAEGYEHGLGFLKGVAIDQHLTQRDRLKDLRTVVKRFPQLLGIGLDESTGILVRKSRAQVLGTNAVFFLAPDSDSELRLVEGQVYDLEKHQVNEPAVDEESR
ncbi:MAG: cyanophycinase [Rhodopirellula sp.]|nr:cyanophycinase [Rhodopirellula sp.]